MQNALNDVLILMLYLRHIITVPIISLTFIFVKQYSTASVNSLVYVANQLSGLQDIQNAQQISCNHI